jgi:hypothetical protein
MKEGRKEKRKERGEGAWVSRIGRNGIKERKEGVKPDQVNASDESMARELLMWIGSRSSVLVSKAESI